MTADPIDALRIDEAGEGETSLIFIHGAFCGREDWAAQMDALARDFHVLSFDLPGHGESGPGGASVEEMGHVLRLVVDRHGHGRSILVGHSLGCRIALEAYRQSPEGIAGLVLVDGHPLAQGEPDEAVAAFRDRLGSLGVGEFMRLAFSGMFPSSKDEELQQRLLSRALAADSAFAEALFGSIIRWDAFSASLAGVKVPLLILQSTAHLGNTQIRSLRADERESPWLDLDDEPNPCVALGVIPGTGHFPHIEAAEATNRHIREFAERIKAS